MPLIYNVYCDESCHLEHDYQKTMVLGAVWHPLEKKDEISKRLREIKVANGVDTTFEAKWTKISPSKQQLYLDLLDYFFDDDDLHFRAVVIPDKNKLNHTQFQQNHDEWYYKMYFLLLKQIFDPQAAYRIYLDIKDTLGQAKVEKLHDILCNNMYDFNRDIVQRVQQVRSHEVEAMQLTDLLIGALSYVHRGLASSTAKMAMIARMRERSGHSLTKTTLPREEKCNLLIWRAQEW
jgi:hypothetical protein